MSRVTIEINSTSVKLMEVEERRVVKWANLSLDLGMFEEVVSDPRTVSAAVKQLMNSSGIKKRDVVASVSGLYSLSRIVMVPGPAGAITGQAVMDAAREVMPLSEEELYISWHLIGAGAEGQQVLVMGVPRDVIDSEVRALRLAGVNPRVMDLKALALIRAVNRPQALILNIEPTSFDIVVVVGGIAEIMRTTGWQESGLSLEDKAEHLALALELTVGFYNSRHPGFPLDPATPLFVTGQLSGDLALVEKLQAMVGYTMEPLTPPLECPAHMPVSQYAVNIGLALKGMASSSKSKRSEPGSYSLPDINFLPQVYRPWRPSARQVYFACGAIAAVGLLFPLYQATSHAISETANLETRYKLLNNQLALKQAEIKKREPMEKAIAEYRTIVDMGGGFTDCLKVINNEARNTGVQVQKITHEGSKIFVACQADNYTAFRGYLTALEKSNQFATVTGPAERYGYVTGGTIELKSKPPGK